jgi:hypothetical protein
MKFIAATAVLCLSLAAIPSAHARELHRHTTIYGPAGITTGYSDRACYNGVCTYDHQVTGPYGYSVGKTATTTEVAAGVYERDATVTGPRGASVNRFSTISVNR